MVVIGFDPGLANTGYGVLEASSGRLRALAHGVITTKAREDQGLRLLEIQQQVESLLDQFQPVSAALEDLYFGKNVSSAFPVAEVRGVLLVTLAKRGLLAGQYSPPQIKQSLVGYGSAQKEQVQEMVRLLLGLQERPSPDHAADALAVAICHVHHREGSAHV